MSELVTDEIWTAAEEAMMAICDTHEDDACACPSDEYARAILEAAAPLIARNALNKAADEMPARELAISEPVRMRVQQQLRAWAEGKR
jgi:hypothetical protein